MIFIIIAILYNHRVMTPSCSRDINQKHSSLYHHKYKLYKSKYLSLVVSMRGGGRGSDQRQRLVSLCRRGDMEQYHQLTNQIIEEHKFQGNRCDFIDHLDKQIHTFKPETLLCLEKSLTRMQEEAIAESMKHLDIIMELRRKVGQEHTMS